MGETGTADVDLSVEFIVAGVRDGDVIPARTIAALGAGSYVAVVLAIVGVTVESVLESTLVTPSLLVAGSVLLGIFVALGAVYRPRALERIREPRVAAFSLVPLVVSLLTALGVAVGWGTAVFWPSLVAAAFGAVGWNTALYGVETHYANRTLDCDGDGNGEHTSLASLPEVTDRRVSRRLRVLAGVFGLLSLGAGLVGFVQGASWWYFYFAIAFGPLAVALQSERTVTVTEHGLLFESRFGRKLLEWSAFSGYYLGDDLVLARSRGWREALTFDLEGENPEAVDAVDRYLPRSGSPGIPVGGLERPGDGATEPAESEGSLE